MSSQSKISKENRLSEWVGILPLTSLLLIGVLIVLIYTFFSGDLYNFYASALFLFYGLTNKMWVAVIMLGIFQTMLLVPLRIIKVIRSDNISEFQRKIKEKADRTEQMETIQTDFERGNRAFIFYVVDFLIQLATFLTIGRLFLTDFYTERLDPRVLYEFVPYPAYPIKDTFFKLPYIDITKTMDFGWETVIIFWVAIVCIQLFLWLAKKIYAAIKQVPRERLKQQATRYTVGYMAILFILSAILIRNFPVGFDVALFTGDVSIPNRTLNTITAIATFLTLLWFGWQRIRMKGKKARENDVPTEIIQETQKEMFRDSVFISTFVGVGAFFITNQIPSAFELSVFTLEIIALFSPLTLDKLILKGRQKIAAE